MLTMTWKGTAISSLTMSAYFFIVIPKAHKIRVKRSSYNGNFIIICKAAKPKILKYFNFYMHLPISHAKELGH